MTSIKEVLKQNNFRFNKQFGQNFITDSNLLNAITCDAEINKEDEILEIGAGAGTLTNLLCSKAKKVVSYEIDNNLKEVLKETTKDKNNLTLIFKDALKEDIKTIESNFDEKYKVVANLPYYITTPLIFKFLEETNNVKSITVMVQKEVGERFCSNVNSSDYSALTVIAKLISNCSIKRIVNRNLFYPVPNVDSCILHFNINKNKYNIDYDKLKKLIHTSFRMKRKTLINNLQGYNNLSKSDLKIILNSLNFDENIRAEKLTEVDFINLFNKIYGI